MAIVRFGMQPTKYRNRPTEEEGIRFDSMAEARRYRELKLLQAHGAIRNLELQPEYALVVQGIDGKPVKVAKYRADFRYERKHPKEAAWAVIVEDVKGYETAVFRLKAKLVKALHGVTIELVRGR